MRSVLQGHGLKLSNAACLLPRSLLLHGQTCQLSSLLHGRLFKSDVWAVGPAACFHRGRDKPAALRHTGTGTSLGRAADLGTEQETARARNFMFRLGKVQLGNPAVAAEEALAPKRPSPLPCTPGLCRAGGLR